ncbi:MAG TPA: toxin-antitoxin system HicB family antitoxin [Micromonosporaceae bacterium]
MELSPYLDGLRRDLAAAAAPGGPDVTRAAELLSASLDASARMCLLEALSDAAAEITTKLSGNTVEIRLRGREAQIVVSDTGAGAFPPVPPVPGVPPPPPMPPSPPSPGDSDAGDITRLTLRLPEGLKEAVERAAAAEGISVNAWLVRAIAQTIGGAQHGGPGPGATPSQPRGRMGRRVTGFAQA